MTRVEGDVHQEQEHDHSESPELGSPDSVRHINVSTSSAQEDNSKLKITVTTASAPEVCLMPSPEVSKRPKSMENNLNDTTKTFYQSRSLSRFNSVKRKQLERLRQRSDWFLGPNYKEVRINTDHEARGSNLESGNAVTRASSEGAVLEVFSDADSVFTDNTSRSESPASEPVRSFLASQNVGRDIIHSDTLAEMTMSDIGQVADVSHDSRDITEQDMTETETRSFVVEHHYGNTEADS
ncbi:hypothetical protein LOTGIDRAFT_154791 [Lottia gigantea]|uniref:Uncharacterized protein n=1 Tax=Lottia gigantea TaxID=225164 RepID=V3Z8Q0_LOTGI|nr:hypothetical protein LOTGIDRAFT_154791 [Lottia gigantea]ESO87293.1 hypothetical protein LOTGIDRAFT_154791 [Lottia gigantea]